MCINIASLFMTLGVYFRLNNLLRLFDNSLQSFYFLALNKG